MYLRSLKRAHRFWIAFSEQKIELTHGKTLREESSIT